MAVIQQSGYRPVEQEVTVGFCSVLLRFREVDLANNGEGGLKESGPLVSAVNSMMIFVLELTE